MSKLRNCETCGKEFLTETGRFCSKECRPKIKLICKECGKEFLSSKKSVVCCSKDCAKRFNLKKRFENNNDKDVLVCLECKLKIGHNIVPHLNARHNMSVDEYKKKYSVGAEAIYSKQTREKFSKGISGDKNPWYNHNGKLSPFSKKFVRYENLTEDEIEKKRQELFIKANKDKLNNTTLEFYLDKGMSKDEAKVALKNRQKTFSLEKCIDKYGEEDGLKRWQARQEKWHKNFKKSNYSKISQDLFRQIIKELKGVECIFAEYKQIGKNNEYVFKTKFGSVYKLDFYVPSKYKIIEFDGEYWHNENRLSDKSNKSRTKNRDDEILQTDPQLQIYHVKERDYKTDPQKVINECLEFLKK